MSFPGYPAYKNSGLDWIPRVPEHWLIVPLKHVAFLKGRLGWQGLRADEYTEKGPFLVTSEHFANDKVDWQRCYHVSPERYEIAPEIQLRPHDLLMMKDGAAMGKLAYVDDLPGPACLNSHLLLFRPRDDRFLNRFLYYVLASPSFKGYVIEERTGTTFFGISQENIGAFPFVMPPLDEQLTIATFLDRDTAKIDALVEEQRQLIKLLKEKHQAIITRAVTKGLDANTPLKDSGVEWLGQVPEHWKVTALRRVVIDFCDGPFGSGLKSEHYTDTGVRVVRLQNIRQEGFDDSDAAFISEDYHRTQLGAAHDVRPGDVLVAGLGDERNTVGRACVAPDGMESAMVKADCFRFRLRDGDAESGFVATQLSSGAAADAGAMSNGSTRSRIPLSAMASRKLALPPASEQRAIVAWLHAERQKSEALITQAERAIELLRERRTALISAAVTGKIDVRGAATNVAPVVQPDRGRVRMVVAAEIMEHLASKQTFGRVKLQKLLYLAEAHANVNELQGAYLREAAGPLDRDMIEEMETKLQKDGFVLVQQPGGVGSTVTYRVKRRQAYRKEGATILGSRAANFTRLIDLLGDLDKKSVEAVTTLYAVWNDALLDGVTPSDDFIVGAFLNDWHPEKAKKFKQTDLRKWLDWMRRHELIPNGTGPRTVTGRLFV